MDREREVVVVRERGDGKWYSAHLSALLVHLERLLINGRSLGSKTPAEAERVPPIAVATVQ